MPDDATPNGRFGDLTVTAFVDRLASAEPVPGGGSASAIAGSLGSALVAMVASLSQGRPKYAEHEALHTRAIERGRALAARFLDLADEDSVAYGHYAAAMKLPRDTAEQVAARTAALSAAARAAADVPLRTVEACVDLVATAEELVGRSNKNASSDLNVAAMLAEAAARGAAENVIVNLPSVGDEEYAAQTTIRVKTLLDTVETLAMQTREGVLQGTAREPLAR
ncbi:MAG TPA: cyclodeaminase/cyclohydrolase family protein [Candidatus Limnocylindrales bacterium]|nr:cyclodeaminase/cyclohydrolase family protein [Candidatus Limnocylindrales bacterium]